MTGEGTVTTPNGTVSGSIMVEVPATPPPAYGTPTPPPMTYAPPVPTCTPSADIVCQPGPDGMMHTYRRTTTHRVNGGLLGGGIGMFVGAYALNIVGSLLGLLAISFDTTAQPGNYIGFAFVPIVGPIAQMFFIGGNEWQIPILAIIEALEIGGLLMAIFGQIGSDEESLELVAGLEVLPWASHDGAGALATVRF